MLPSFTRPPSRMRVPGPMCFSAMSLGELKNTIASRNALSISAAATASTPSPPPIRTRRRCLRVIYIRLRCMMMPSAFQPEAFDELVDPLDIVRTIRQRVPGIGGGILGLVAVAEYRIGAHQAQPAFDVAALGMQAIGQAADHAADHFDALLVAHIRRGGDVRVGWAHGFRNGLAGDAAERGAHETDPRRAGRRLFEHGAPARGGTRAVAVLLVGKTEKIPRLGLVRIARHGGFKIVLGLIGHDAVGGSNQSLAEIGVARRGLAVERKRFAPRRDRVVEAAE